MQLPTQSPSPLVRRRRMPIDVVSDSPAAAQPFVKRLRRLGFGDVRLTTLGPDETLTARFELVPSASRPAEADLATLMLETDRFVGAAAIDARRYPLQRAPFAGERTLIRVPIDAAKRGLRPPYAGSFPERFRVRVECRDRDRGEAVVAELIEMRYAAFRRADRAGFIGCMIRHANSPDALVAIEPIRRLMERTLKELDPKHSDDIPITIDSSGSDDEIFVALPLDRIASGELRAKLMSAERHALTVFHVRPADAAQAEALCELLRPLGWKSVSVSHGDPGAQPAIEYGGTELILLKQVQAIAAKAIGGRVLPLERRWSESDRDVWIKLPPNVVVAGAAATPSGPEPSPSSKIPPRPKDAPSPSPAGRTVDRPFIVVEDDHVLVGCHRLPRRSRPHAQTPDASTFTRYFVDGPTAANLTAVAESVTHGEPCLLEGATATSKTSSVLYLASLLGQPVIRLNLSRQAEVGDLVGRFAPFQGGWRWQPGAVERAMRTGLWLVLDELNLAESAILERLNPVFEMPPSLTITENDGAIIGGAGGDPVHPDFRIFASQNPTEGYAGRAPLSPALRDRFVVARTRRASEHDLAGMLAHAVLGRGPSIAVDGILYRGHVIEGPAPYARLAQTLPGVEKMLQALARFHAGAEAACDAAEVTGERPVITRRALLAFLARLHRAPADTNSDWPARVWSCLDRLYFGRYADASLHDSLVDLAIAVGFAPDRWIFE